MLWKPVPLPAREKLADSLKPSELQELWEILQGSNAQAAFQARLRLVAAPKDSVAWLKTRLGPVTGPSEKQIESWIDQLDSHSFKEREAAMRELEKAGELVENALRKELTTNPPLEVRQRIEIVLAKQSTLPTAETLRTLRAVTILESIGSIEARAQLQHLASGAPGSRVTRAAQAALKRMKAR
jgi:hypothetical protein